MQIIESVELVKLCNHNRPILIDGEIVCGVCGVVDSELSAQIRPESSNADTARSSANDHNVADGIMIINMGSQHAYVSPGNTGLAFQLSNPMAKDFEKKKCAKVLEDGYSVGNYLERNGDFRMINGREKFKVDYSKDLWLRSVSQQAYNLAVEMNLKPEIRGLLGIECKRLYSSLIIGLCSKIVPRMAIARLDYSGIDRSVAKANIDELDQLKGELIVRLRANFKAASSFADYASMIISQKDKEATDIFGMGKSIQSEKLELAVQ